MIFESSNVLIIFYFVIKLLIVKYIRISKLFQNIFVFDGKSE